MSSSIQSTNTIDVPDSAFKYNFPGCKCRALLRTMVSPMRNKKKWHQKYFPYRKYLWFSWCTRSCLNILLYMTNPKYHSAAHKHNQTLCFILKDREQIFGQNESRCKQCLDYGYLHGHPALKVSDPFPGPFPRLSAWCRQPRVHKNPPHMVTMRLGGRRRRKRLNQS